MKNKIIKSYLPSVLLLAGMASAHASITGVSLGTAAPPGTLGGWTMAPFPDDPRPDGDVVGGVTDPFGRTVLFSQALTHDELSAGWLTWSHGYTGDAYDTAGSLTDPTELTMTLPDPVHAFYFYAEPTQWDLFTITAVAQDGTTVSETVNGNGGARGFGFYTDAAQLITSVRITGADPDGFAVGEFAVDGRVPDGGTTLGFTALALVFLLGGRAKARS